MTATHAAPSAGPDRELTGRLASLCRAQPATFAQLVREADQALAAGSDPSVVRAAELAALDRLGF